MSQIRYFPVRMPPSLNKWACARETRLRERGYE
jgi:hypothetical protein